MAGLASYIIELFLYFSFASEGAKGDASQVLESDGRYPRQATGEETTATPSAPDSITPISTTLGLTTYPHAPGSPKPTKKPGFSTRKIVGILVGTVGSLIVLVLALGAVSTITVICLIKMSRRRREDLDLVLRTKHDIFEGVPNVATSDCVEADPCHNVLDSSPTLVEGVGEGRGAFELNSAPTSVEGTPTPGPTEDTSIKIEEDLK